MKQRERVKRDRIEGPVEEERHKKKASQPLNDKLKAPDEGVVDFQAGQSFEGHAAMLSRVGTDAQRADLVLHLQQAYGNKYVQRLVESMQVQAKLTVSSPDDEYEKEADRVAAEVTRNTASSTQRQEAEPLEGDEVSKISLSPEHDGVIPEVTEDIEKEINSARGGGQPLADSVRSSLEPQFGHDFSQVHIHTDAEADKLSQQLSAQAFTTGKDIFFREGTYQPGSDSGKGLIAHELTHVVQQQAVPAIQRQEGEPGAEGAPAPAGKEALPLELSVWTVAEVKGVARIETSYLFDLENGKVSYSPTTFPLTPGQEVLTGTEIILEKDSTITLKCGSTILKANGGEEGRQFTLTTEGGEVIPRSTVKLLIGKLWAKIVGLEGKEPEVETGNAAVGVRG
jgi:hypothetical protein